MSIGLVTSKFSAKTANLGKRYRCVFLHNVAELERRRLGPAQRHSSATGAGWSSAWADHCLAENYQDTTAAQLLPATLVEPKTPSRTDDLRQGHRLLRTRSSADYPKELDRRARPGPGLSATGTSRPTKARASSLTYADKSPALIERVFKGSQDGPRPALDDPALAPRRPRRSPDAWNEFPVTLLVVLSA